VFFLTLSRFVKRDDERRLEKRGIKKVMFSWRMMKKKAILSKTRPTSDVKERR
jgi:hypothetical protein